MRMLMRMFSVIKAMLVVVESRLGTCNWALIKQTVIYRFSLKAELLSYLLFNLALYLTLNLRDDTILVMSAN